MMFSLMTAAVLAASPVSLNFNGSLKDGLQELAQKSGINLVVQGDLDERVQLNLPSVDGEEALETIAQAYGLEVTRSGKGKLWVVKRGSGAVVLKGAGVTAVTPGSPDALRAAAEAARAAAERAREEADALREKTEALREKGQQAREATDEVRTKVQEAADEAREQAQEAADEAREKAQEAAELAREQAQEAAEAEQERQEALREKAEAQQELVREKVEHLRHRVSTGGPVTVDQGTHVETAVAYGGPVIIEEDAVVEGDAVAFGGDVVLKKGAVVEGDAVSFGGVVVRGDDSKVHGDSVSMGGSAIGSAVARNVVKTRRSVDASDAEADAGPGRGFGRGLAAFLLQFAVFFGLGFVLMMFAPQRMKALEATVREEPVKNGVVGLLGLVAAVPLTVLLVVTLVGIPVAVLMWVALALFVPVGLAVVANTVGAKLPTGRLRKTQALVLAVGLLALLLVSRIPGLGQLAVALSVFVSLGAIIRTRFGQPTRGTPMLDPTHTGAASL